MYYWRDSQGHEVDLLIEDGAWTLKSHHPSKAEYESYRAETEWANKEESPSKNQSFMFKVERLLFVVLPASMYLRLFKAYHGRMLLKSDRKANSVSR